ncbi:hypothetical protein Pyn_22566 [Prunus yedoensis var. nudiflora]|uniref:Uncharacterized protein n=1 Tax=Prunus yedoensis var. nudiflora TaxID=2094558 RepID=A0A314ZIB2_PRUYE|nr:hypothetical protein Pyn_22566 [Prunus yedoensis var. nudiflora]
MEEIADRKSVRRTSDRGPRIRRTHLPLLIPETSQTGEVKVEVVEEESIGEEDGGEGQRPILNVYDPTGCGSE